MKFNFQTTNKQKKLNPPVCVKQSQHIRNWMGKENVKTAKSNKSLRILFSYEKSLFYLILLSYQNELDEIRSRSRIK